MNAFPFTSLIAEQRELGLIVAVVLGFCFGFVLERAGFGRANKLAAQFYLTDMTVFKVMFSAIVTAMLGVLIAAGVGAVDLAAISASIVAPTYIWPMLVGGLLLGVGFIVSGYCPGTSAVAAASGNLDGVLTFVGVIGGSLIYGEAYPLLAKFHVSGDLGHFYLYQWLGLPPIVLGLMVTLMAVGMFLGAEKVEQLMARRRGEALDVRAPALARPRRMVFAGLSGVALVGLVTLALPERPQAETSAPARSIGQAELARRVVDAPWSLRIVDLRGDKACAEQRIPGATCSTPAALGKLGLAYMAGVRDLVLVGQGTLGGAPPAALAYPGQIYLLDGGFAGWRAFALTRPQPPGANASAAERAAYRFRAAVHGAMTGIKPPPPAPAATRYVPKPKKKKGGGCS